MTYSDFIKENPESFTNKLATGLSVIAGCSVQEAHHALLRVNPPITISDKGPALATTDELPDDMRRLGELLQ